MLQKNYLKTGNLILIPLREKTVKNAFKACEWAGRSSGEFICIYFNLANSRYGAFSQPLLHVRKWEGKIKKYPIAFYVFFSDAV